MGEFPVHRQSRLFLRFKNREIEKKFGRYQSIITANSHRTGIYFSVASWIISGLGIQYGFPGYTGRFTLAGLVILPLFILVIWSTYSPRFRWLAEWFAAMTSFVAGILLYYISLYLLDAHSIMVPGLITLFFFASFILRVRFTMALFTSLIQTMGMQIILVGHPAFDHYNNHLVSIILWIAWFTCVSGTYFLEQSDRKVFLMQLQLKDLNEKLKLETFIDPMTRLYNRQYFFEFLRTEMSAATRFNHKICLAMIDIDHFKKINDELGHPVGDTVILKFAEILGHSFRDSDIIARYGGEEFILLIQECDLACSLQTLERFMDAVRSESFDSVPWSVTCSIGIVQFNGERDTESLVSRADALLYRAKRMGRNRICS